MFKAIALFLAGLAFTASTPYVMGWWVALWAIGIPAWLIYCLVRG